MSNVADYEETIRRLSQPMMFVALAFTVCEKNERGTITDEVARQQMRFLCRHCSTEERGGILALWSGLDEKRRKKETK